MSGGGWGGRGCFEFFFLSSSFLFPKFKKKKLTSSIVARSPVGKNRSESFEPLLFFFPSVTTAGSGAFA